MSTMLSRTNRKKNSFNSKQFGHHKLGKIEEVKKFLDDISSFDVIRDTWNPNDSIELKYSNSPTSLRRL